MPLGNPEERRQLRTVVSGHRLVLLATSEYQRSPGCRRTTQHLRPLLSKKLRTKPRAAGPSSRKKIAAFHFIKGLVGFMGFVYVFQGGTGMERALYMRLHLLQGVLAFHKHNKQKASELLKRVRSLARLLLIVLIDWVILFISYIFRLKMN